MKYSGIPFIILFFCQIAIGQCDHISTSSTSDALIGNWTVDLRPLKESEPYYKEFEVNAINGTSFFGTFYDTPFENGRINTSWDRIYFAFTTSDNSNEYFHSGYILDGEMHGLTYCIERGFTMPWTGNLKLK